MDSIHFWSLQDTGQPRSLAGSSALQEITTTIESLWKTGSQQERNERSEQGHQFILLTASGDTSFTQTRDQGSPDVCILDEILRAGDFGCHGMRSMFIHQDRRWDMHISQLIHYSGDDRLPTSTTIIIRSPRNSRVMACAIRVQLTNLSCFCFLYGGRHEDVQYVTTLCTENAVLLRKYPLYLLAFLFEERYARWIEWSLSLKREVSEIESATGMTRDGWEMSIPPGRLEKLLNLEALPRIIYGIHNELCHCETVSEFALRMGPFYQEAVAVTEKLREQLGLTPLAPSDRSDLGERLKSSLVRCQAMRGLVLEQTRRLQGQINVTFSFISQRDSQTQASLARLAARQGEIMTEDSATMKTISLLTLIFLPASLVSTIWSADIFRLSEGVSWWAWLGTVLGSTMAVLTIWMVYQRHWKRHSQRERWDV